MAIAILDTPVGRLGVHEEGGAITRVTWDAVAEGDETPVLTRAITQLRAYFAGELQRFDLPLRVDGSAFQRAVCDEMSAIPFGDTVTYGDIAKATGKSAQAVGSACGGNPIPIIIPCHRVLGAGDKMVGFSGAGGVETKVWLLRHEGAAGLLI
ncbi:methylated-DNA--[protein]-cysteine S-methyltransferase [Aliiroseovarius subalbicans]|uniref:methylated-DNA--[protein]-cysteine S-methyltransferase n=1 Tax=Aliiroseovarius subalbicans TaxID=2925840 RepID=UPI001F574B27|nr:methylated-DNA--[protein]-cysteine S-methyltransferase [Aliiroseovarius subalbicans]MCI2400471.1 methylated-DNA--[protein]-cysteine S-methyltransferase [Aliiroseovarius subalbicans]